MLALLQEFHRESLPRSSGTRRARDWSDSMTPTTPTIIINREATQLSWIEAAIRELGGPVAGVAAGPGPAGSTAEAIFDEDVSDSRAFVERWRPRVEALTHARHRQMLRVILGEVLEQQRFFEQARAGRTDLLGRRGEEVGARVGSVMADRWIE
jgi:hypothetical protein